MKIRVHKLIILRGILATNLLILIAGMATLFLGKASFMLSHKIKEENIPSIINYMQAQNRVKEMRFNEVSHLTGNIQSAIRFEESYQEYLRFVDKLARLKLHALDDFKKVDKIESIMEDYIQSTYAKNKGIFTYNPKAERLAKESAAELIKKSDSLYRLLIKLRSEESEPSIRSNYRQMRGYIRTIIRDTKKYLRNEAEMKKNFQRRSRFFLRNLKILKEKSKDTSKLAAVEDLYNQIVILSENIFSYDPQIKKDVISSIRHWENWAEGSVLKRLDKTLDDSSTTEMQRAEHRFYQLNELLNKIIFFVIALTLLALVTAIISIFMIKSMGDEDSKE